MIRHFILASILFISISGFTQKFDFVYPKKNQVILDSNISVIWNEVINADFYQIQVATDSLFQVLILDSNNILQESINLSLNIGSQYYLRFRFYSTSLFSQWSSTHAFYVFNPKSIDSLVLWLSSDTGLTLDASGNVSQWSDLSGNGNNVSQTTMSYRPHFQDSVFLGNSAIYFDNDKLIGQYSDSIDFISQSFFIVEANEGLLNRQTILAYSKNNVNSYKIFSIEIWNYNSKILTWIGDLIQSNPFQYWVQLSSANELIELILNSQNNILTYHNRQLLGLANLSNNPGMVKDFILGSRYPGGNSLKGYIPEIVIYNKVLSDSSRKLVENYIKDKYTPPVNLGQNILRRYGFCDTVLRTEAIYESYLWSTGDTTREISIAKEDTGWYWCEVPNLYEDIMRDSVYVYNLLPKQDIQDTTLCFGDTVNIASNYSYGYTNLWQNSNGDTLSSLSSVALAKEGPIVLSVFDSLGCYITDTCTIHIDSFPIQASLGADKSLCTGDKIGLEIGANEADSFLWNTGSTDSLLVINTVGTYNLQTWNTRGCFAKDTIEVDIHGVTPYVAFSAAPVCFRDSTSFIDSSMSLDQSNLINWKWEFGDGTQPTNLPTYQLFKHPYLASGTYTVRLTVSTDSGCTNYAYRQVLVRPLPQPDFYPLTACQNHEITYNNLTTHNDSLVSFFWNFGNGDTVHQQTTNNKQQKYIYTQASTYSTTLTAADIHGCSDSIIKTIEIRPSPFADFINSEVCEETEVSFSDNSITLPYNPIQSRIWEFDSLTHSLSSSPSHTFAGSGLFPVKLTTTALNGCWDTITKNIQVHAYPIANYTHDTACLGANTAFNDLSSITNDSLSQWQWSVYQGSPFPNNFSWIKTTQTSQKDSKFSFQDTLYHPVELRISTPYACADTLLKIVKVHPLPKVNFTTNREYGLPPLEIQFTNLSTANNKQQTTNNLTYLWNFGDNSQSIVQSPNHIYTDSSIFYPQLITTNALGCKDSITKVVYVIYAAIDVAVTDVVAEMKNNYISYSCVLTNLGKQSLKELELGAKYNAGPEVSEKWTGNLISGASTSFTFSSSTKIQNPEAVKYFCITASLPENASQADENLSNNSLCKDLDNQFWVGDPYPNPVSNTLLLDLTLPFAQNLECVIADANARTIKTFSIKGKKGLNQVSLSVFNLKQGHYTLIIKSKDHTEVRRFLK